MSKKYSIPAVVASTSASLTKRSSHIFYISSSDSAAGFPDNRGTRFTYELPSFLMGVETISLMEFYCDHFIEPLLVFCDTVKSSHVKNTLFPVLRTVNAVGEVGNEYAIDSTRSDVIRMSFEIRDLNLDMPPNDLGTVRLVLRITTNE